jgi:hypothetical protein
MKGVLLHIIRFFFILLLQVLVLNQLEIGFGIQIFIYPLFIFLLPVEIGVFPLMFIAFVLGMGIDSMSDTYGLHSSSLLAFAYLRPAILKLFAPRDGYDALLETNVSNMGFNWFVKTFGLLLLIHHFWFFLLELFKINEILLVLQKTFISGTVSFLMCILLQYLFIRNNKKNEV